MAEKESRERVYEGLVLFDSKEASSKWDSFKGQVLDTLKKHGAEILRERKWSDRRLAYEIGRVRRGTYLLVHFAADPSVIVPIRQDLKMAEPVLREMILRMEGSKESYRQKEESLEAPEAPAGEGPAGQGEGEARPVADGAPEGPEAGKTEA